MSDWKQSANRRRLERQAPASVDVPKLKGRKDTKRWCRGKPGVEHKGVCKTYAEAKPGAVGNNETEGFFCTAHWRILVCSECGKELASFYPMRGGSKERVPEWVTK